MRPRWHDWVIVTSIVVLGCVGILSIWGDDLLALIRDVSKDEPAIPDEAPAVEPAEPAAPAPLPPAAGTTI